MITYIDNRGCSCILAALLAVTWITPACSGSGGNASTASLVTTTRAATTTSSPTLTPSTASVPVGEEGCAAPIEPLGPTAAESPIDLEEIEATWYPDVAYGTGFNQLLDVFVPASADPTPLAIFIHGGGFTGGDKDAAYTNSRQSTVRTLLRADVAVATINYSLLKSNPIDPDGVIRPLTDSARALQFLRHHAATLNIDPFRVATWGSSAGAGTSLWLGTRDDLADPNGTDPVLCHSTRVVAAGAIATQATYNIPRWEEVLYDLIDEFVPAVVPSHDLEEVVVALGRVNYALSFVGMESFDELKTPEAKQYLDNVDMLALMDADDAPIFVRNGAVDPTNLVGFLLHHPLHARAVHAQGEEVGLEVVAYYATEAEDYEDPSGETLAEFLLRHLLA